MEEKKQTQKKEICQYSKRCGGCAFQGMSYEEQLEQKQKTVKKYLKKYVKPDTIVGMYYPYHYRNKVAAAFGRLRNGTFISGTYEEGTHRIVPIESCMIEDKNADRIVGTIRGLLKSFKIKTYDEDSGYGLLRHVLVRVGKKSKEVLVVLVLGSPVLPSKKNFVKALCEKHPEITSIVINVNDRQTSMVLGEKEQVIYGKGFIIDTLCGLTFKISPKSFYQVNPVQTEKLYGLALEYADLHGEETVWDLYCGIGTISLFLAQKAKQVYGVEIIPQAIENAKRNAVKNGIENAEFFVGKSEEVLPEFYEKEAAAGRKAHADVIVVDPPRKGCDEKLLDTIVKMAPDRVVYVSCDSATLARDLKILCEQGYELKRVRAVDQFCHTVHTEAVCCLHRVNM